MQGGGGRIPPPGDNLVADVARLLDDLYSWRDACPASRATEIQTTVKEAIDRLDRHTSPLDVVPDACGRLLYLRGKALNALNTYCPNAEQHLTKAIKLTPSNIDAWNCLGEQFWKKNDLASAHLCFSGALKRERNKITLRLLSMVLRQMGQSDQEKQGNVTESLTRAKESLALDISDAVSWYILGNAYLANFFVVSHDHADIVSALKSYQKAETQPKGSIVDSPDFYYNRAVGHKCNGDYQAAVEGFARASQLDPSWKGLDKEIETLTTFMQQVRQVVTHVTKSRSKTKAVALREGTCDMTQLVPGENAQRKLHVRVSALIPMPDPVSPVTVVTSDAQGACGVLSVRSAAHGALSVGDCLVVSQPLLRRCTFKFGSTDFAYDCVFAQDPAHVLVIGKGIMPAAFPVFEMNRK